jgi:glycerate-2-kinase
MARAAEEVLGALITDGIVVTPDAEKREFRRLRHLRAAHPTPDNSSIKAAREAIDLANSAGKDDLVLCLISGGTSSLLSLPAPGILIEDLAFLNAALLKSGADIAEVNCVRKHVSSIKGGRLAQAAMPAQVATLIMSDVVGDDPSVIASGPTAPDETTYSQAEDILKIRGLYDSVPRSIKGVLSQGMDGLRAETLMPGDAVFEKVKNEVITSNFHAVMKAVEVAGYMDRDARLIDGVLAGEAKDAGKALAEAVVEHIRNSGGTPACLIAGGETTVTVNGFGLGGRNQETALAFAKSLPDGVVVNALFAGTDGIDGPTEAAGAFVDGTTIDRALELGIDPEHYLAENDSYNLFQPLDDLFTPGPTGTNVMDIAIIFVDR